MMRLSKAMKAAGDALASGEIELGEFFRRTGATSSGVVPNSDWAKISRYVFVKLQKPPAVTEEDVAGELLFQACRAWERGFDPKRSDCCASFLVWVAISKTKMWMHAQRGAGQHGKLGEKASNIGIPASWLDHSRDDGAASISWLDTVSGEDGSAEEAASAREAVSAILACLSKRDREALEVVLDAGGDLSVGAGAILGMPAIRRREWLGSEGAAVRYLDKVVERVRGSIFGRDLAESA